MKVIDYNGEGFWCVDEILKRYTEHARAFGIQPRERTPLSHSKGDTTWIYPVMDRVALPIVCQPGGQCCGFKP